MNIVFDIGGSRMRFAKVLSKEKISDPLIIKTPNNYLESINQFKESVEFLSKGEKIENLVGGIAGVLSKDKSKLLFSPNLKDWEKKPLQEDIERLTGAKNVILRNDTNMTGLGEAVFGAGKNHEIVAYLTFSTGIGGSLIINKQIAPYRLGFEPGFQIINEEKMSAIHEYSGASLKKKYDGKLFKDIKDQDIRNKILRAIAIGIHNTIVFWSPDVIVLGGGMTEAFKIEEVKDILQKIELKLPELPEIKFTELGEFGENSGLYGSLAF